LKVIIYAALFTNYGRQKKEKSKDQKNYTSNNKNQLNYTYLHIYYNYTIIKLLCTCHRFSKITRKNNN